jgi:hypothetical protein
MLIDTRILARHSQYAVLGQSQQVVWPDGSNVTLHDVRSHGIDQQFLRALLYRGEQWLIFDLRTVERTFERDLRVMPRRDAPGLVLHTLRLVYRTAPVFLAQAMANPTALWFAQIDVRLDVGAGAPPPRVTMQPELRSAA